MLRWPLLRALSRRKRPSAPWSFKWPAPTQPLWRYWERLGGAHGGDRNVAMMATAAARLVRAYATQVETLRRLRNGGSQFVRVEHVQISEGGQAIIGNVTAQTVRRDQSEQRISPTFRG